MPSFEQNALKSKESLDYGEDYWLRTYEQAQTELGNPFGSD